MQTGEKFESGIIAIVRSADTLRSLHVRVDTDREAKPGDEDSLADLPALARMDCLPFAQSLSRRGKSLLAAWDRLSSVVDWNAPTLEALLIVLIDTVPLDTISTSPPYSFDVENRPRGIRPTAAHPRAYQGTTYKPPKTKSPQPIDVRPFLCDRKAVAVMLAMIAPHWDTALASLLRCGYGNPESASPECDPYTAWNHYCRQEILTPALDTRFRSTLLPAVKCSWGEIETLHTAFHRLRLQDTPELLASLVVMLSMSTAAAVIGWCEIVSDLPSNQWIGFAGLLLRSEACKIDPATLPGDFHEMLTEAGSGIAPAYRIYCLLRGAAKKIDCRYLLDGFRLNDWLYPGGNGGFQSSFHEVEESGNFAGGVAKNIIAHLEGLEPFEEWHICHAWSACAKLEGFGRVFSDYDWTQWPPAVCQALLKMAVNPLFEDYPSEISVKWAFIRDGMDTISNFLRHIHSEYQWKFCDGLRIFAERIEIRQITQWSITNACVILSRMCDTPFHQNRNTAHVWVDFVAFLSTDQVSCVIGAPASSFIQLEKACRVKNSMYHIGLGTWAMAMIAPAYILASFTHAPSRLFRTARTLGCLPQPSRLRLVSEFMRQPIMQIDTELLDNADAYAYIASQSRGFNRSPIPASLLDHYQGKTLLNTPRLAHYHGEMRQEWQRALLMRLEDMAFDHLALGLDPAELDDNTRHALQIRASAKENRRPLKKLLAAYWSGKKDYAREHPRTQNWLKRHPRLNVDLLTSGVPYTNSISSGEEITISLETDSLEALKLGTYVGSCLGLGGSFAFSAAAIVLDINKQVLYARNSQGSVVGRQVVTYSAEEELVCFEIYPRKEDNELEALFADYDHRFAAALNIPIFVSRREQDEEDREYEIDLILANGWWDDYHWEGGAMDRSSLAPSLKAPYPPGHQISGSVG